MAYITENDTINVSAIATLKTKTTNALFAIGKFFIKSQEARARRYAKNYMYKNDLPF